MYFCQLLLQDLRAGCTHSMIVRNPLWGRSDRQNLSNWEFPGTVVNDKDQMPWSRPFASVLSLKVEDCPFISNYWIKFLSFCKSSCRISLSTGRILCYLIVGTHFQIYICYIWTYGVLLILLIYSWSMMDRLGFETNYQGAITNQQSESPKSILQVISKVPTIVSEYID